MAYKALEGNGLAFDLLRSEDIRNGRLTGYGLLFVPGGWASNKMKALGNAGIEEIRKFIRDGGSYVGFCGGAGLATLDGIGLLPVKRRSTKERVPSFSGPILLNTSRHPVWEGVSDRRFHAWWPSQFVVDQDVSVLATYGSAMPEAFSSDLNVGDTESSGGWVELEHLYQINLDPRRLLNEPAVVEGRFGSGKVLLSLVHFDTPGDSNGAEVLKNLWNYLLGERQKPVAGAVSAGTVSHDRGRSASSPGHHDPGGDRATVIVPLESAVSDLIELGRRNFLWFWRNPLLLQWRRGVRGLEYCTLYVMVKEVAELMAMRGRSIHAAGIEGKLERIREFAEKAKQLLVRERYAMQNAHITYERCDDPEIQALREELFSRSKSHGGLFKEIVDDLDALLYDALVCKRREGHDEIENHLSGL
jgi:hypothetical protein